MRVVLVNASAAKHGGAREIFRRYINSLKNYDGDLKYVIFCPDAEEFNEFASERVIFVNKSTSGLHTFLFSTLFIIFYGFYYKAAKIISFNNVNAFFSIFCNRVTYFHQEKAISGKGLRLFLIRFNLRFQKNQTIIAQSTRIRHRLNFELGIPLRTIVVLWPGIRVLKEVGKELAFKSLAEKFSNFKDYSSNDIYCLLPIYSAASKQKDLDFFFRIKNLLNSFGFVTISLCPIDSNIADINIGIVDYNDMDKLYEISSYLIISSIEETLCLPMFEYVQTGKMILARDADFVKDFKKAHPLWLASLSVFDADEKFESIGRDFFRNQTFALGEAERQKLITGDWNI